MLYFLCYFKHKNLLWQNYGLSLEQVVVPRALQSLGVAAEAKGDRARLQDWHPEPHSIASETSMLSHGACELRVGEKKQPFLTLDSIFPFHLDLDWKRKI